MKSSFCKILILPLLCVKQCQALGLQPVRILHTCPSETQPLEYSSSIFYINFSPRKHFRYFFFLTTSIMKFYYRRDTMYLFYIVSTLHALYIERFSLTTPSYTPNSRVTKGSHLRNPIFLVIYFCAAGQAIVLSKDVRLMRLSKINLTCHDCAGTNHI